MQEMKREESQDSNSDLELTILYQAYGYNKEAQERIIKTYNEASYKPYIREVADQLNLSIE